jgi:ethanolamine ammonia-lyase small subunit
MASDEITPADWIARIRRRTPARVMTGRYGGAYSTESLLALRQAHAAAKDAVLAEVDLSTLLPPESFTVSTLVRDKEEYLLRPDLGRRLADRSRQQISERCSSGAQLQIVIGDGLSANAVITQSPALLPLLIAGARARNWTIGRTFAVRYCRVGIMNDVGDLLHPEILVLLIGERPGLATAESLSAYLAYRPHAGNSDADRNLISNIHARGTTTAAAAERVLSLAAQMLSRRVSGATLKEEPPTTLPDHR